MNKLKIYFCGSIRGGRDDAALYAEMIEHLKHYGTVLTEHVGDPGLTDRGGDGTSEYIWQRDTAWLDECDLVIAECTHTSLGVGYELAYAEAKGKPVHVFYGGEEGRLSAMIAGCPSFSVHTRSAADELPGQLDEVMKAYTG